MRAVDRSPARFSQWSSAGAGLVAVVSTGIYSWPALATGTLGLVLLVGGLVRGARRAVTLGALGLFVGAILAGSQGVPILPVLVGVTAAVLARDVGGTAIGIGAQLGREADTVRLEAVHVATSTVVGVVVTVAGVAIYRAGVGGRPILALVLLVVAAVLLVETLD